MGWGGPSVVWGSSSHQKAPECNSHLSGSETCESERAKVPDLLGRMLEDGVKKGSAAHVHLHQWKIRKHLGVVKRNTLELICILA